jgi:hypothetical protein
MRCAACGYESKTEGERFCEVCGKPLSANAASTPTSATGEPVTTSSPPPSQSHSTEPAMDGGRAGKSKFGLERWRPLGWVVLAVVLYLTIADAAVESFLRGSPLRWYIAAAAILYLGSCAAFWRIRPMLWARWSWANQAAASFLILLALLTATAWLPGGLEEGLSLFGQPTSIVLSVLSAVVVAICGILLARLAFVPRAGKIAIGLVTAYGVVAFLLAVKSGTPYASLFHGGSMWTRLPVWLQGAVLGGLLLVTVALLLEFVTGVRRLTRAKLSEFFVKITALALSLVIMLAALHEPTDSTLASTEGQSSDGQTPCNSKSALDAAAPGAGGAQQLGGKLGGLFGASLSGSDATPTEPCRPDAKASAVSAKDVQQAATEDSPARAPDPAERLVQLRNSLQMPSLDAFTAAHQGSAVDLFAYVRDKIKLDAYSGAMRGALGAATSRAGNPTDKALLLAALLRSGGATVRFARATLDAGDVAILVDAARTAPAPPPTVTTDAAIERLAAGVSEHHRETLRAQLVKANSAARTLYSAADAMASDILNKLSAAHIELGNDVQMRAEAALALRDHVWVQMQNGSDWQDLDTSLATLQPGQHLPTARNITTSAELPDDQYVMLELRAVATRLKGGLTVDTDVISASQRIVEVLGGPAILSVGPDSNVALKDLGKTTSFRAHIHLASDDVDGDSFEIADENAGPLLALRMVLTVKRPGFGPDVYTRTVVDRRDRTGAIADDWTDMSRVACSLNSRFTGVLAAGALAPVYVFGRDLDELIDLQSARSAGKALPAGTGDRFPYAALRLLHRAQALRPVGTRFVVDRPNIVFERTSVDCPSGHLVSRATLDIMENGQAAVAANAAAGAHANLVRGAIDEAIEADLLGAREVRVDTPSIIAAAVKAKIPVITLRAGDTAALKALSLPISSEQAIAVTLSSGHVAAVAKARVTTAEAAHAAWWAIDPASGNTIGRADDGAGQEMVEYPLGTANGIVTISNVMEFGFAVEGCLWRAADANLRGGEYDVGACEQKAVCAIAVSLATDAGYSVLGMLYEEPGQAVELAELLQGDLETLSGNSVSAEAAVCGKGGE